MVEILISLVVLSVGLLGLAGLQMTSLRYNHDGHLLGIATSQIQIMVDRMRANPEGITAGNYDNQSGIPTNPNCTTCTPAQQADLDVRNWNTTNATLLPAGSGAITANGNNEFTIILRWDNDRTGATGTNCSGDSNVDLMCLSVNVRL